MTFTNKQILRITMPVLLSLMMEQLIGLTDTAYLGRVGEIELGASALAGIFYLMLFMLGFGFSIGAQVLIARRNGETKFASIGPILNQGVLFLLSMALILSVLSHYFSPYILHHLIESEQVAEAAISYLDYRVFGLFFSFTGTMFRAFYVGTTRTRILTISSLTMVGCNVILNYLLIFGEYGFPKMGIAGAAIASTISEAIAMLFIIVYTYYKTNWKLYGLFKWEGIKTNMLKQILGISIWTMIQEAIAFGGWFIFFIAIEHLGERPLAITNVVRSISSVIFMFINAFASTSSALVSNLIGAGAIEEVRKLCKRITLLCFCFVIPLSIIAALFPYNTLSIYTDNPELINASVASLWVMLTTMIPCVPAFVYQFSVSGTGNTKTALFFTSVSALFYVAYTIVLVYILQTDVAICWTTDHLYYMITFILSVLYIRSGKWKKINI